MIALARFVLQPMSKPAAVQDPILSDDTSEHAIHGLISNLIDAIRELVYYVYTVVLEMVHTSLAYQVLKVTI